MTLDGIRTPAWRSLAIMLCVSLTLHLGFAVWATWENNEVLVAGGAETPATTVGQAFADMLVAGTEMPITAPEVQDPENMIEPEEIETPRPVQAVKPHEIVPDQPQEIAAVSALTAAVVNASTAGNFVKAETTIDTPLEAEAVVQEKIEPVKEPPLETAKPKEVLEANPIEQTKPVPEQEVKPQETDLVKDIEPLKSEPAKPVEVVQSEPLEMQEPVEQQTAEAIPVPQVRPKPLVRDPPKKAKSEPKKPHKKVAKTRNTATGAGGGANRTAQKGGATKTGRGSEAGNAKVSNYPGKVRRKIRRAIRYPSAARKKGLTGNTVVSFTVDAAGRASGVRVVRSSGSPILDKAALDTVRRASPFPKVPPESGRKTWRFEIPIGFGRR
ncbi:TonB family protein [Roseibium sp.]|uniref:energy transducer TonB n=1 Tax=Roseibium sp. TaxID=1936156 RepID=UPI003A977339